MNLEEKYKKEVIPEMMTKFKYPNVMAVPRIKKITINIGLGKELASKGSDEQKKFISAIFDDLASISGQKPSITIARKSIAGFKLREGNIVGAKVTLRGKRMYSFLGRFIGIALPRSRDFEGIGVDLFDKMGNLTIGIKEHIIFPEVQAERMRNIFGFQITITISGRNKEENIELLRLIGFPIKK